VYINSHIYRSIVAVSLRC